MKKLSLLSALNNDKVINFINLISGLTDDECTNVLNCMEQVAGKRCQLCCKKIDNTNSALSCPNCWRHYCCVEKLNILADCGHTVCNNCFPIKTSTCDHTFCNSCHKNLNPKICTFCIKN